MALSPKEMETMPVWQNHENRITNLEATTVGLSKQMDNVEAVVREGNEEQKELLNRLINHHLDTNKIKMNNVWRFLITLVGGGSFLYLLFDKLLIHLIGG